MIVFLYPFCSFYINMIKQYSWYEYFYCLCLFKLHCVTYNNIVQVVMCTRGMHVTINVLSFFLSSRYFEVYFKAQILSWVYFPLYICYTYRAYTFYALILVSPRVFILIFRKHTLCHPCSNPDYGLLIYNFYVGTFWKPLIGFN